MEKLFQSLVYQTPTPSSISYFWNFGSLLGICLGIQLISGFFLAMRYKSTLEGAFESVIQISEETSFGWLIRSVHANGASMFFLFVYLHIGRSIFFNGFSKSWVWNAGVVIFLVLMVTSFLGYVLPWGQMSLWGATVITNLLSAIPYFGESMVQWVWGGFSVSGPTLLRFFSIHFILPFVILVLVFFHIFFLHLSGSSNLLGVDLHSDKVNFHPFFVVKDLLGILVVLFFFSFVSILKGDLFMDPDNFIHANPLSTPPHIQPEWYFLFAYSILRAVPNKLGGVIGLVFSILVLFFFSFFAPFPRFFSKVIVLSFFCVFFLLTWVGGMPVMPPFIFIGQVLSVLYFGLVFLLFLDKSNN